MGATYSYHFPMTAYILRTSPEKGTQHPLIMNELHLILQNG